VGSAYTGGGETFAALAMAAGACGLEALVLLRAKLKANAYPTVSACPDSVPATFGDPTPLTLPAGEKYVNNDLG
jgi:hypothetical protein